MAYTAQPTGVAGLILAAGASSRMPGPNKLARSWNGGALIEAAVGAAVEAGLHPCIAVVGCDSDLLIPSLEGHPVVPFVHSTWSRGRASSVAAGLTFLSDFDDIGAVVVLLGDEPQLSPCAIRAVIDVWRAESADLVRVRYEDRPGHPVLLGPAARDLALTLEGEGSVWGRLTASGLRGIEVTVGFRAPIDVDVPSALATARARQEAGSVGSGVPGRSD